MNCQKSIRSTIPVLLFMSGPAAIIRLVSEIVIDSVQAFAERPLAHVCVEVLKREPSFADGDTSASIPVVSGIIGIGAAPTHASPYQKFRTALRSLGSAMRGCSFNLDATTTIAVSASQCACGSCYRLSAITNTLPDDRATRSFFGGVNSCETAESLSEEINGTSWFFRKAHGFLSFFGLPPFLPFSRAASDLAGVVDFPPFRPRATAWGFFANLLHLLFAHAVQHGQYRALVDLGFCVAPPLKAPQHDGLRHFRASEGQLHTDQVDSIDAEVVAPVVSHAAMAAHYWATSHLLGSATHLPPRSLPLGPTARRMGQPVISSTYPAGAAAVQKPTTFAVCPKLTTTEPMEKVFAIAGPLSGLLSAGLPFNKDRITQAVRLVNNKSTSRDQIFEWKAKPLNLGLFMAVAS